ncbi:hypothetical protein ACNSOL_12270 (plasmid) [Aliarcobacter lanthieri]|uniref:hypothetical protein n=1 Tax=Aliarcobacter lanthieri TaxID=1355374 RepID=UPI003AB0DF11
MTTFTNKELQAMRMLVVKTRTSIGLQKKTDLNLVDISELVEKIDTLLRETVSEPIEESKKDIYDISIDDNFYVIEDTLNNVEYKIHRDLVDCGKVAGYIIEDRDQRIEDLEDWIGESKSESDKYLMREDLEYLRESKEGYVFSYYGTNGFIAKDVDIEEFNKICLEIIESYQELCYSVKVTDIKWDFEDDNYDNAEAAIEKHYWILPSTLESNTLEEAKEEIEELISDKLSDDEGFCHNGFKIEIKEPFDKSLAEYLKDSRVDLNDLTKEQLLEIVEHFEHYPSVTENDDKDYVLAYFKDESCLISEDQIQEFIKNNYECRCNNCMSYFKSDDDLEDCNDGELIKGCPECKTDSYLINLGDLK